MKNHLFLFTATIVVIAISSVAASAENDEKDIQKLSNAIKVFSAEILHLKVQKDPTESHSFAPFPILCILAQLSNHADKQNYKKIMEILNANSKGKLKRLFMWGNSKIEKSEGGEKVEHNVFTDNNYPLRRMFTKNYASICGGLTENIDFSNSCKAANAINQWFKCYSNTSRVIVADDNYFKNTGFIFTQFFKYEVNLNHRNNPSGVALMNFYTAKNETKQFMAVYGNAFVEYFYMPELDTEVIKMSFNESYGYFIHPINVQMLPYVEKKFKDMEFFDKVVACLKPMCVNIKLVMGAAHMVNKMGQYIEQVGISLKGYQNVFKNKNCDARVNEIIQVTNLTATPIDKRDTINSPMCPGDNYREVNINSPLLYHLMYDCGAPRMSGVFTGEIYGGDV